MKQTDFKKYNSQELREIIVSISHDINLLPEEIFKYIKKENRDISNEMTRINRCYNLIKQEIFSRFIENELNEKIPHKRYETVSIEDFHVLLDLNARQTDLKKGDSILFTPSEGERKIYIYDSCDGYGMGVYDLDGQRYTIAYSRCCKIVRIIDKKIDKLPDPIITSVEIKKY